MRFHFLRPMTLFACLYAFALGAYAVESVETASIKEWYAVAYGGLNMRDKPAMAGKKLATIPFGTKLEATGNEVMDYQKSEYWTEVRYKDLTGWVSHKFLNTQALPENAPRDFDWRGKVFYNAPSHWKHSHGSTHGEQHGLSSYTLKDTQYLLFEKTNRRVGRSAEWTIVDFLRIEKPKDHLDIGGGDCADANGNKVLLDVIQEQPERKKVDNTIQYRLRRAWVADTTQDRFVEIPAKGIVCKILITD